MKPPTMLIAPKAIAMKPISCSRKPSATPATISPPSMTIPWIAFVWLISGVCRVVGTFEITAKPTKAARTKITSSVVEVHQRLRPFARCALVPDLALVRDAGAGDDLVVEVEAQLALLVEQQAEQVLDVLRVELRGVGGHVGGQVDRRDHLDAVVGDDRLAALGELAVAARVAGEVDDHRARAPCWRPPCLVIRIGAGRPGIWAVVMITSCLPAFSASASRTCSFSSSVSGRA